jgi:signal transduction histidine kinase
VKFTGPNGRVSLRVGRSQNGKSLQFAIEDTGIGFDPALTEAIFRAGIRLDKSASTQQSTGLGLTLCKRIVEAHQGSINAVATPGQGSVFTVVLPLGH